MTFTLSDDENLGSERFTFTGEWRLPWETVVPTYVEATKHRVEHLSPQRGGNTHTLSHILFPPPSPTGGCSLNPPTFPPFPDTPLHSMRP